MSIHTARPVIMGILNVTPDSFSDGGLYQAHDRALQRGMEMMGQGADIIDVGAESTRPGSDPVSVDEQIQRSVAVVDALSKQCGKRCLISIDTTSSEVARAAIDAGAGMINDVSAGRGDDAMLSLAASRKVPIVLMHMQGTPDNMQNDPQYTDVVAEVCAFLRERTNAALAAGVESADIIVDPGIGFGKRKAHNLGLLAALEEVVALGQPVLLGTSRKRFMGRICDIEDPHELVPATCATTTLGVMSGVAMFRVHDVAENRQCVDVAWAIRQAGYH